MTKADYQAYPARSVELQVGDMVSPTDRAVRDLVNMPRGLGMITRIFGESGSQQIAYVWWFNRSADVKGKGAPINTLWLEVHRACT